MEYREHVSYPGFGWIDPIQDQDCPLVAEETAIAFIEHCESIRQQLAAALAACEAKDRGLDKLARLGNEPYLGNSVGNTIAAEFLSIKPDASALKAHDEALIERCAEVCEESSEPVFGGNVCANAIRNLKGTL